MIAKRLSMICVVFIVEIFLSLQIIASELDKPDPTFRLAATLSPIDGGQLLLEGDVLRQQLLVTVGQGLVLPHELFFEVLHGSLQTPTLWSQRSPPLVIVVPRVCDASPSSRWRAAFSSAAAVSSSTPCKQRCLRGAAPL